MPLNLDKRIFDPDFVQALLLPADPALPALHEQVPQASVLLLICAGNEPTTILTLRSAHLSAHPGQISLPGGCIEVHDKSFEATALREANEEINLDSSQVRLLGRLPITQVSSGTAITPIVGWTPSLPLLKADPGEVAAIIHCPLQHLMQPHQYQREALFNKGVRREYWVIHFQQHRIWGATANILRSLACRLHGITE